MDGKDRQCYWTASEVRASAQRVPERVASRASIEAIVRRQGDKTSNQTDGISNFRHSPAECFEVSDILSRIKSGRLLLVNGRRRNGLILYKGFHAEFAGPGAVVGGFFDQDCHHVIPVGDLSLIAPESHEERQKAYLIRRQWIRLTQQFTDKSVPVQRAQMILNQFENYFDQATIVRIPDEAFALLVGVLPDTVKLARRPLGGSGVTVKVKA